MSNPGAAPDGSPWLTIGAVAISSGSPQFRDWLAHGDASQYAGMFLTYGAAFPGGSAEVTWTENGTRRSAPLAALP